MLFEIGTILVNPVKALIFNKDFFMFQFLPKFFLSVEASVSWIFCDIG